nr:unnamed protein product [Digitaria exilis]
MLPGRTPTASPRRRLIGVGGSTTIERETGRGVFLSWQAVSVTALDEKGRPKVILDRFTRCERPSQVLALMGPGSGKTTLPDTLSVPP